MSREWGGALEFAERNVDRAGHEVHHGDVGAMILNGWSNKFLCNKTN